MTLVRRALAEVCTVAVLLVVNVLPVDYRSMPSVNRIRMSEMFFDFIVVCALSGDNRMTSCRLAYQLLNL